MTLPNWLPQAIADKGDKAPRADSRVAFRTKAGTTAKLVRWVAGEDAKRTVNRDRASGSTRAGQ